MGIAEVLVARHTQRQSLNGVATETKAGKADEFDLEHQSPVSNRIRAMVDEYLEAVRNEQTEPPEGPQQLLDHFMLQVKTAVYQYKESNRLTGADLKQMFPSTKDPGTVISRWKPNN